LIDHIRRRLRIAVRRPSRGTRRGYAATVDPSGVLAVVDQIVPDGRREDEVMVDPSYLPVPVRRHAS
jgi:hypothetical protein